MAINGIYKNVKKSSPEWVPDPKGNHSRQSEEGPEANKKRKIFFILLAHFSTSVSIIVAMFQPWLLLVLSAAVVAAFARIFQKKVMANPKHDSITLSFLFQFSAAVIFLLYGLLTQTFSIPDLSSVWFNVILMIILYAAGNILSFLAFEFAEASEASILFPTSTIWSVVTALIFLGERLTNQQLTGIVTMIVGIMFTYFEKTSWRFNKGHIFALVSSFFYGIAFTNDIFIMNLFSSVASYMFMIFLLPALAILLVRPALLGKVKFYFSSVKAVNLLFASIIFYCFSTIAYFTAYRWGGQASLISPIFQTSVIFTVLLSAILLNEKKHLWQKLIGALVAFAGVILIIKL